MEILELIKQKLSTAKPYTAVILKKGENYDAPDTQEFLMTQHVPYLFKLRQEGLLHLTGAATEATEIKGIALYSITDKEQVKQLTEEDPAVKAGKLNYEIFPFFGFPGDGLP